MARNDTVTLTANDWAQITNGDATALEQIGNAVNIVGKAKGLMLWNTTTGAPVYATGSGAASVWNDATGTTAHTPV